MREILLASFFDPYWQLDCPTWSMTYRNRGPMKSKLNNDTRCDIMALYRGIKAWEAEQAQRSADDGSHPVQVDPST